jgi:hypothetical protein
MTSTGRPGVDPAASVAVRDSSRHRAARQDPFGARNPSSPSGNISQRIFPGSRSVRMLSLRSAKFCVSTCVPGSPHRPTLANPISTAPRFTTGLPTPVPIENPELHDKKWLACLPSNPLFGGQRVSRVDLRHPLGHQPRHDRRALPGQLLRLQEPRHRSPPTPDYDKIVATPPKVLAQYHRSTSGASTPPRPTASSPCRTPTAASASVRARCRSARVWSGSGGRPGVPDAVRRDPPTGRGHQGLGRPTEPPRLRSRGRRRQPLRLRCRTLPPGALHLIAADDLVVVHRGNTVVSIVRPGNPASPQRKQRSGGPQPFSLHSPAPAAETSLSASRISSTMDPLAGPRDSEDTIG